MVERKLPRGQICGLVKSTLCLLALTFIQAFLTRFWVFTSLLTDESPFILEDAEYLFKYRAEIKSVILRAKARPRALLKGYSVCLAPHVQPAVETLSTIVRFAGGKVC